MNIKEILSEANAERDQEIARKYKDIAQKVCEKAEALAKYSTDNSIYFYKIINNSKIGFLFLYKRENSPTDYQAIYLTRKDGVKVPTFFQADRDIIKVYLDSILSNTSKKKNRTIYKALVNNREIIKYFIMHELHHYDLNTRNNRFVNKTKKSKGEGTGLYKDPSFNPMDFDAYYKTDIPYTNRDIEDRPNIIYSFENFMNYIKKYTFYFNRTKDNEKYRKKMIKRLYDYYISKRKELGLIGNTGSEYNKE
jgi:hypothetical protein